MFINLDFSSKMSTRKKIISILAIVFAGAALCGCGYNELPPKTSDASKSYIKPKGEIPTQAERDEVNALKAEYDEATTKTTK